jgi:hypothetical protein
MDELAEKELAGYDRDFNCWTKEAARLLREGRLNEEDRAHVAEEIRSMGKRELRELHSRLMVLMMHLLKWQALPKRRVKSSWLATINEQRREINLMLEDSPSMRNIEAGRIQKCFTDALRQVVQETGLPIYKFQVNPTCYNLERILDVDFLPD